MDVSLVDEAREFSTYDANELLAIVCNRDTLLQKKRRWLERPPYHMYRSKLMRRKIPKFLLEKFVPESYVRSDEVSCDIVRSTVAEGFRFSCNHLSQHHVVAHSFDPLNSHATENNERISSTIHELNNSTLYTIACIIAPSNPKFKTRSELIAVVKDNLTNYLLDASRESDEFHQLLKLFKNPNSYFSQNNLKIVTPVTDDLLQSVYKTMERLDDLTIRELYVTFRRLNGEKFVPHFPPVLMNHHYSTQSYLLKVKKLFNEYISNLKEGQEIPKELANGLTVIILSIYSRIGSTTVPISEFCVFPKEVMSTQREILCAVRLLHKMQKEDIEILIPLIDPSGTVPRFKETLRKYMIEWLFVCDEISVPEEVLKAIDLINKSTNVRIDSFTEENKNREVESVLNVSCYLKSVAGNLLLGMNEGNYDTEEVFFSEEYDEGRKNWCSENNDFDFCGDDYFCSVSEEGFLGKDMEGAFSNCISESVNGGEGCSSFNPDNFEIQKNSSEKPNGGSKVCLSKIENEIELNVICDKAALIAHKLIGQLIHGFLKSEKREVNESTLSYLTDGLPDRNYNRDGNVKSNGEEETNNIILDAVEKMLPSFPKSSLAKVKNLLGP